MIHQWNNFLYYLVFSRYVHSFLLIGSNQSFAIHTAIHHTKMQYCIHCINNKFQKIVFLYDTFIWHWKELRLSFGIRDYAFEPEAQNMTNSRLIVVCASICVRIWSRICGNNTWMLSANGYRNAWKISFHYICVANHTIHLITHSISWRFHG